MYELMVESNFEAAHQLLGYEGPCEKLHGHSWRVQVFLEGENVDKLGMVIDFKKVKGILKDVLKDFDHQNLNDLPEFKKINPTCENVAKVIYERIKKEIKEITKVAVWESGTTYAAYFH